MCAFQGHDFIDSIMFIYYYGKNVKSWKDLGGNIVIIGAGFSIFAQILTIILVSLRNGRMRKNNAFFPITMNLLVMLFLSNLLFIVGVQSNKNPLRCEIIALLLHYLYLTSSVWCFVFIFIIYDLLINESLRLKMRFILLMAYVGPAIYVMVSVPCFDNIGQRFNTLVPVFLRGLNQQPGISEILLHVDTQEHDYQFFGSGLHPNCGHNNFWHHMFKTH